MRTFYKFRRWGRGGGRIGEALTVTENTLQIVNWRLCHFILHAITSSKLLLSPCKHFCCHVCNIRWQQNGVWCRLLHGWIQDIRVSVANHLCATHIFITTILKKLGLTLPSFQSNWIFGIIYRDLVFFVMVVFAMVICCCLLCHCTRESVVLWALSSRACHLKHWFSQSNAQCSRFKTRNALLESAGHCPEPHFHSLHRTASHHAAT